MNTHVFVNNPTKGYAAFASFSFDLLEQKEYDKNREKNLNFIDKKSTFLYNKKREKQI